MVLLACLDLNSIKKKSKSQILTVTREKKKGLWIYKNPTSPQDPKTFGKTIEIRKSKDILLRLLIEFFATLEVKIKI